MKQIRGVGETGSAGKQKAESNSELRGTSNSAGISDGVRFTPNQGQIVDMEGKLRPDILYNGSGAGADIYIRKTGLSYVYSNTGEVMRRLDGELEEAEKSGRMAETGEQNLKEELMQTANIKVHRVDMNFAGCRDNVSTFNEDETAGISNYYYAHCPNGILNVKQYNKVVCKNIYENIDVIYYGEKDRGLKYDLVVNPHADPYQIKLNWAGAENIHINPDGDLVIRTSVNEFFESIPKVYQIINGSVIDVKARYVLNGTTVGFELEKWNPEHTLIIDPATWITYYGGNGMESCTSVAVDLNANPIFTGSSPSPNFPVTAGAFQMALSGTGDAFIAKFDPSGVPIFSTYFGGTTTESANGISVDTSNDIYVTGTTTSTNMPTRVWGTAFMQAAYAGGTGGDAFVIKLSPAGALLWSTYYGGTNSEGGMDIATDGLNNIYFTGTTLSTNLPKLAPYQAIMNGTGAPGPRDPYVVKFNNSGVRQWATYFGGCCDDDGTGITTDAANNVYICGITQSANFPLVSAFQGVYAGGVGDAYLSRLDPATGFPVWSTFYGGGGDEGLRAGQACVAADALGNVFLGFPTTSVTNIATAGTFQPTCTCGGLGDGAVIKFTNAGARVWGTYFGGTGNLEELTGLAVDVNNNIVAAGDTYSTNMPVTSCAYQKTFAGSEDQYIATFDQQGQLICSGYIGIGDPSSPNNEVQAGGGSIAVSGCFVYLNAMSNCTYPVTANAYQPVCGGNFDCAFSKLYINTCGGVTSNLSVNDPVICAGQPANYTSAYTSCNSTGISYSWSFQGGTPLNSTQQNPSVTYSSPGVYTTKLVISLPCGKDSIVKSIVVNSCTITAATTPASICPPVTCANLSASGSGGSTPYTYTWSTGAATSTISVCPLTTTSYTATVTDAFGNYAVTIASVSVNPSMNVLSTTSTNISCTTSGSATVSVANGPSQPYTYNWSTGETGTTISCPTAGNYTLTITDMNGCSVTKVYNITGTSPVSATFTSSPGCVGTVTNFINTGTSPGTGVSYSWTIAPANGLNITSGSTTDFSYTFLSPGSYSITHTVISGGCNNKIIQNITIVNCNGPTVTATGSSVCAGSCASVSSNGTSGTSPYTYSWSNGATTQNINPCPVLTTTYTVTIKDSGGNSSTSIAIVTVNPTVTVTTTATNITCNGSANGSVLAAVTGGSPTFTYSWSNGGTASQISNLTSQIYTVTVTDSKGCTAISVASIISPSALVGQFTKGTANCVTCGCKEWLMINAAGGTGPYSYSWPDGYLNRYKNQLCPGSYSINIKDKNGCSVNVSLTAP